MVYYTMVNRYLQASVYKGLRFYLSYPPRYNRLLTGYTEVIHKIRNSGKISETLHENT